MSNVSVTQSNFRKGIFKNLRTALLNVHVDIGTSVYGSYPIKNISLPLIVIENAQKTDTEKSVTGNLTYPGTSFISIYTKQAEKIDTYADAIEAAFCKAVLATFVGSIIPASNMSVILFFSASNPTVFF